MTIYIVVERTEDENFLYKAVDSKDKAIDYITKIWHEDMKNHYDSYKNTYACQRLFNGDCEKMLDTWIKENTQDGYCWYVEAELE